MHRRADKRVHEKIEKLYEYIMQEESKMIIEMHKTIEKEQSIDENVQKMIQKQHKMLAKLIGFNITI
ncbi:MAG TPA: hypothetical protein VIY08_16670 [Candidatus Nitrosocosmicus sp.]